MFKLEKGITEGWVATAQAQQSRNIAYIGSIQQSKTGMNIIWMSLLCAFGNNKTDVKLQ